MKLKEEEGKLSETKCKKRVPRLNGEGLEILCVVVGRRLGVDLAAEMGELLEGGRELWDAFEGTVCLKSLSSLHMRDKKESNHSCPQPNPVGKLSYWIRIF